MVAVSRAQRERRKQYSTNPALLVHIYRSRRQLGKVANGRSIRLHTGPSTDITILQTLKKDKPVAASSPTRSRKGKEPMREGADFSTSPFASDSGYQKKKYRMNGIADLARMTGTK